MRARRFINNFSNNINGCSEDQSTGFASTMQRFVQLIEVTTEALDKRVDNIYLQTKEMCPEEKMSYCSYPEIDNELYYFKDMVMKNFIVSICSYLDAKTYEIIGYCEEHFENTFEEVKKKYKLTGSFFTKRHSYFTSVIIPELDIPELVEQIKNWTELRNCIVHGNSIVGERDIKFGMFKSISNKYGSVYIDNDVDILLFAELVEDYLLSLVLAMNEKYDLIKYTMLSPR